MDPDIWGPHYWFMLHTMAFHYPLHPTSIQKKLYFRFIHNLYEFIPNKTIGTTFQKLLVDNPVTPYLDTRKDFVEWMHHIHNAVNTRLDVPHFTLADHYAAYALTSPRGLRAQRRRERLVSLVMIVCAGGLGYLIRSYRRT